MKDFKEYKLDRTPNLDGFKLFVEYKSEQNKGFYFLNESENAEVDKFVKMFESEHGKDLSKLDETFIRKMLNIDENEPLEEGFLGTLFGGAAGLIFGVSIGKIVANALGVEKGVLYDMFTSRLVTTALGAAIGKHVTSNKK